MRRLRLPPLSAVAIAVTVALTGCDPPGHPLPVVASVAPDSAIGLREGFTLTVHGRGFVPGSVVHWNDVPRQTTFHDATRLSAHIPVEEVSLPGEAEIRVLSPPPGGGVSDVLAYEPVLPPGRFVARTTGAHELLSVGSSGAANGCIGGGLRGVGCTPYYTFALIQGKSGAFAKVMYTFNGWGRTKDPPMGSYPILQSGFVLEAFHAALSLYTADPDSEILTEHRFAPQDSVGGWVSITESTTEAVRGTFTFEVGHLPPGAYTADPAAPPIRGYGRFAIPGRD